MTTIFYKSFIFSKIMKLLSILEKLVNINNLQN